MGIRYLVITIFVFILSIFSIPVHAANISGFVKNNANNPADGAELTFICPSSKTPFAATADKYGRYRVKKLPNLKWCDLSVKYKNKNSDVVKVNSGKGSKDINVKLNAENDSWKITL